MANNAKPTHQRPYGKNVYFQAAFGVVAIEHGLGNYITGFMKRSPYPEIRGIDTEQLPGQQLIGLSSACFSATWIPDAVWYPLREYPSKDSIYRWERATERDPTRGKRYDTTTKAIIGTYKKFAVEAMRAAMATQETRLLIPISGGREGEGLPPSELEFKLYEYVQERGIAFLEEPYYAFMVSYLANRIWDNKDLTIAEAEEKLHRAEETAWKELGLSKGKREYNYPILSFRSTP